MPRPKKDSKPFSIKMDSTTYMRLEAYCKHSGQPKTLAIERAINMFIDDYDEKMKRINESTDEKLKANLVVR